MILPATFTDIDMLLKSEIDLFDNSMNERMLRHELTRGFGWIYGDFEGYILAREDEGLIDVTRLAVRPESRRRGIGRILLERVILHYPDSMLTVQRDNLAAVKLYAHYGFSIVAHYSGVKALVLRRTITST